MVKIKLSELNPNPFKNGINDGELNEEIISKIMSNIKELGLMGALPVFKKDNRYYLIAGHHRVEALKRTFGKNYEIEVTVHNYNEDQILRGMVVENLTQRADELVEVADNLALIRDYLMRSDAERINDKKIHRGQQEEPGSIRHIHEWLNKNGEVMSIGKIQEYLKIYDNLDRRLLKKSGVVEGGQKEDGRLSIEDAKNLARLEKSEQFEMKKIMDNIELSSREKGKLITHYNESPEDIKEKVKSGEINLSDVPVENLKRNIKKKIEEEKENNKNRLQIIHFKRYQREAGNKVGNTNSKILQTCVFLNGLEKSGVLYELDWKTMLKMIEAMTLSGKNYSRFGEKIMERIR